LAQNEKQVSVGNHAVTVWDGSSWSNGLPNASTKAVFAADYLATESLSVLDIEVLADATVTFDEKAVLTVANAMDVAATGKLSFGPQAQLIRKNHEARRAPIDFVRETGFILKFDYTYFCSPVEDQQANLITDYSVSPNVNG